MSVIAILHLESIGLLGDYCPLSKTKGRHLSDKVPCMHFELSKQHQFRGWCKSQCFAIQRGFENNCAAVYTLNYNWDSLVNGSHDTAKLAGLLENFIKKYVQCYGCGNPETEILITKSQMVQLKCAACGFVSDVDMRDKLTSFILKNPPETKKGSKDKKAMRRAEKERLKEGEAADEENKKLKKDVKKKPSSKDNNTKNGSLMKRSGSSDEEQSSPPRIQVYEKKPTDDDDDDDDVQWQTDTSLEAAKQRIQEQLSAATADMVMLSIDESNKSKNENKCPHDILVDEIKSNMKNIKPANLQSFLDSLAGSSQDKATALFEALFDGVDKGFAKEAAKKKNYLSAIVQDDGSQLILLQAIESFSGKLSSSALKEVALVLKQLYDAVVSSRAKRWEQGFSNLENCEALHGLASKCRFRI
ncbi:hypothetical protein ACFE04_005927 [Oxalis oulophora]